ncbi:MAG: accCc [Candidatus Berkelbacteria bacterium]|nr:accCc [Candidatus Berkelbacteria bacterium]
MGMRLETVSFWVRNLTIFDPFYTIYWPLTPATGIIYTLELPKGKGIRIDTHLSPGFRVSSVYDPLLAKLIVHAGSRPLAIKLAERALRDMDIDGVTTMLPFLRAMMGYGPFRRREGINTAFLHECLRL